LLSVLDGSKTNNGGNIALYNSTTGEVIWETNTNSENENYDCQQISKDGDYIVGIRQFNHGINIPFLFNTS